MASYDTRRYDLLLTANAQVYLAMILRIVCILCGEAQNDISMQRSYRK